MPKLKTNRSAAKRFKVSKTGKIMRRKAFHSHILTKKDPKRKRRLRTEVELDASDRKRIKRMLGI